MDAVDAALLQKLAGVYEETCAAQKHIQRIHSENDLTMFLLQLPEHDAKC